MERKWFCGLYFRFQHKNEIFYEIIHEIEKNINSKIYHTHNLFQENRTDIFYFLSSRISELDFSWDVYVSDYNKKLRMYRKEELNFENENQKKDFIEGVVANFLKEIIWLFPRTNNVSYNSIIYYGLQDLKVENHDKLCLYYNRINYAIDSFGYYFTEYDISSESNKLFVDRNIKLLKWEDEYFDELDIIDPTPLTMLLLFNFYKAQRAIKKNSSLKLCYCGGTQYTKMNYQRRNYKKPDFDNDFIYTPYYKLSTFNSSHPFIERLEQCRECYGSGYLTTEKSPFLNAYSQSYSDYNDRSYCGGCMSSPCICSDNDRT